MEKRHLVYIVIFLCMCAAAWAQEIEQVVIPLSDEYIREWLIIGPFFPDDLNRDFLTGVGGEANVQPKEGDTAITSDGGTLTWKRYKSRANVVNLLDAVGNHENATAYAFCILQSEISGDARFYLGSDDGIAVWINGKQVHNRSLARALRPDQDMVRSNLKTGQNRCLIKVSQGTEAWGFSARVDLSPPSYAVVSGLVTNTAGNPIPNTHISLKQNDSEIARTRTDDSGNYSLNIHPASGYYDLYAVMGDWGDMRLNIPLRDGQHRNLRLTLREAISIEGTLLMMDDKTPHVAVVVQAVLNGKVMDTALSDENGKYKLVNLKSGRYQVRCYTLDGYVYYTGMGAQRAANLQVERGRTIRKIDFRFAPFKKGTWKNYSYLDGLTDNWVYDICHDAEGMMWFATGGGGVSQYDGKEFVNFTTEDGLVDNDVWIIHRDPDGALWFGTGTFWTEGGGVSRYDGNEFVNFTTEDGLAHDNVFDIHRDPDGVMWFATGGGVSRYDGNEFVNFSTEDGLAHNLVLAIHRDPDGMIWFATGGGVSRYDGKKFISFTSKDGLTGNDVHAIYCDSDDVLWFATGGGVSRYDGREFTNFTTEDGLANNDVRAIHCDPDGVMWFGTGGGGISRYDGKGFINFTTEDGLVDNSVFAIYRDPDEVMWFGTAGSGVSRYDSSRFVNFTVKDGLAHDSIQLSIYRDPDGVMWFPTAGGVSRYNGNEFVNFTTKDGLAYNGVWTIHRAPDGVIWFGTFGGGVSRYDGKGFTNFTVEDGLANDSVPAIHCDPDGVMWFGTRGGGVSRYDGKGFTNFAAKDGLAGNIVWSIRSDPDGVMWFGTWGGGASRYDGKEFVNFTTKDGLASNDVNDIYRDSDGVMWFGTRGGISRYDGKEFLNFTIKDGLASNIVDRIHRDPSGIMWFGTGGGGVAGYDGNAWTSLDTRDGLAGNQVFSIYQDPDGFLWFGTVEGGIIRYRRSITPPKVYIASVTTDQTYRDLSAIPAFAVGTRVTIEYSAIDFKTVPEKRQYRYRVRKGDASRVTRNENGDSDWQRPTKETSFDWIPEKSGTYTFEVQAIDRDLNYSDPASLSIVISSPFYRTDIFLIALCIIGGGSLIGIIMLGIQRWRSSHAEKLRLHQELEDAHQMQISLLPKNSPVLKGFDIAGFSSPAREVGGDFFDYISLGAGKVGIALGDVSGKGLKGAMNAIMASTMLYEATRNGTSCGEILSLLNSALYPRTPKQMFTALGFGILDQDDKTFQWANAGQPYPLVRRGERVFELESEGELPLGMAQDMSYPAWELDLQAGDIVIFYTDGIIEAERETGRIYGISRLERIAKDINTALDAAEISETIIQDVSEFVRDTEQYDDITIIVVKKL